MPNHPSRRHFIGTAAATAAWTTFGRLPGIDTAMLAAGAPGALKLGVASYSMRAFPLDQALEMARALGVTYMTFKDVHVPRTDPPAATRALRAKIEAAGITIMGGGTITIPNDPVQIEKEFVYAKNAGFPLIYVDPEPAALDTIERMAKVHDIRVAIHNHGPEDKRWPRPQDAYAAIKSRTPGAPAPIRCRRAASAATVSTICT
jgi:inosose dehydratase